MLKLLASLTLALPLFLSFACSTSEDGAAMGQAPEVALIPKESDSNRPQAEAAVQKAVDETPDEIISLEAKKFDCNKVSALNCNPDEPSNAHRCALVQNNSLLIADDQQISARGDSRCLAKSALESKLCSEKVIMNAGIIECHPDAAPIDECTAELENCDAAPQEATRCFAKELESSELAWTNRPEAWGKSECEARNNLRRRACDKGIAPSEMKAVACEKEVSPVVCPAIQQNCLVQGNDLVECRIRKIGDVPLRESLKGFGSTACEASYRVKDLACRWQRKPISDLNEMECRSITKGESFPASTAKAKIYKKVQKLSF